MAPVIIDSLEMLRALTRPLIFGFLLLGLWIALSRARIDGRTRMLAWLAVAIPLFAWFGLVWELAQINGFRAGPNVRLPALPLAVILPVAISLPLLMRSQRIAAALDAIPASWLIGFQVYRVLGGVFLLRWAQGGLPAAFALPAGTGDVLTGLFALPVALYMATGARGGRAAAYAWNIFGVADLVVAVTMGVLTSLRLLGIDQPNTISSDASLVLIPAFAVPLSLILHGLSLWQLRRRSSQATPQDYRAAAHNPRPANAAP
jgi:hypothetical protein